MFELWQTEGSQAKRMVTETPCISSVVCNPRYYQ